MDKLFQRKLSNMAFICALFVLLIHTPCADISQCGVLRLMLQHVLPGAAKSIAVPYFFCLAGFLVGGHVFDKSWQIREFLKRIRSLVVPYVTLNLLWMLIISQWYRQEISFDSILKALGVYTCAKPIIEPLWFIRSLVLYVMTLFVVAPILKSNKKKAGLFCFVIGVASILQLLFYGARGGLLDVYRPYGLFYFCVGVFFRVHGLPQITRKIGLLIFAFGMGVAATCNLAAQSYSESILDMILRLLSTPCMLFGLWFIMPDFKLPEVFVKNTFSIFALHAPLEHISFNLIMKFGIWNLVFGNTFLSIMFIFSLVLGTICMASVLRRYQVTRIIFLGGR